MEKYRFGQFFFFKELKDQHYQNYKHLEKKIKIKENRVGPCYLSDRGKGGRKEKALKHEKQQTIKMTEVIPKNVTSKNRLKNLIK